MNQIKFSFCKCFPYSWIRYIRDNHSIFKFSSARPVTHYIFLFFYSLVSCLFILQFSVLWCKYTDFMSPFTQPACQSFHGHRNTSHKGFIIVCHHCNLHILLPFLSSQNLPHSISQKVSCSDKYQVPHKHTQ